jgi:uncharacterized RDD family membrane protein YckC
MKNIEIKTAQNVVLQYELADLRDRILAFIIDMLCLGVGLTLLSLIGFGILGINGIAENIYGIILLCVFVFYSLFMETRNNGQTIGKKAMRIQVIKTQGGSTTFADYAARWTFRLIDIYLSLGGIACIMIASSSKAQRIGDIVGNTAVVKLMLKQNLELNNLLTIHSQASYNPVYLQAKQLHEEDALLIKTTLERYNRFMNEAHDEALHLMAKKIKQVLSIENAQGNDKVFLQTVLNDYVVLTR